MCNFGRVRKQTRARLGSQGLAMELPVSSVFVRVLWCFWFMFLVRAVCAFLVMGWIGRWRQQEEREEKGREGKKGIGENRREAMTKEENGKSGAKEGRRRVTKGEGEQAKTS